jgi:predicted transcriptional regulator
MSDASNLIELTADIVSAHVSNNAVSLTDVAGLVQGVYASLARLGVEAAPEPRERAPAVSVRASVRPDVLVCLECGRKQKILKRHLLTAHGLTPDEYRRAFGLPASYPMVAADYSERRAELAKSMGLGRRGNEKAPVDTGARAPSKRGRKAAAAG